jgi:uncharacterized protein YjbI with pentapeptide repeats
LRGSKLTGADLTDARIIDLHCEEVLLAGAKLAGLSCKQRLRHLDFSQADLRKADLRETVFEACSLRDATLTGARFEKADLRERIWADCDSPMWRCSAARPYHASKPDN